MNKLINLFFLAACSIVVFSSCSKGYKCDCTYDTERVITTIDKAKKDAKADCNAIRDGLYERSNNVDCRLR